MQERVRLRQLSYAVVFGTLWGTVEMTAGGLLHALHVPFSGILLAGVGAAVLAFQRALCPVRGITLTTGFLAAGIKILSMGGVFLSPLLAVITEALLAEAVFCLLGPSFLGAGLAGFLMGLWSCAQGLIQLMLLYGVHWIDASVTAMARHTPSWTVSPLALVTLASILLASLPASGGILGLWSARRLRGSVTGSAFASSEKNA